mgnify:CR=1 FL=1
MANFFDFLLGSPPGANFYFKDFRNAYQHRPDQDPPRQQFNGYVNFIFNRTMYEEFFDNNNNDELRISMSNQLRSADLPGVTFKTETLNEYNRKKIVNTGVEYQPVNMKVIDSVSNTWLVVLMKYFTYHYMDPRNRQDSSSSGREMDNPWAVRMGGSETQASSFSKGGPFDSNKAGYNPNITAQFFERIDYVLYHGNRGVQYSLINPVLTGFSHSNLDYTSSELMEFDLNFEYESFTMYDVTNFELSPQDTNGRFEDASGITGGPNSQVFLPSRKSLVGDTPRSYAGLMGRIANDGSKERNRTSQPTLVNRAAQLQSYENDDRGLFPTYQEATTSAGANNDESKSLFGEFLGEIVDRSLTAAINGGSIGDAALGAVFDGTAAVITASKSTRPPKSDLTEPGESEPPEPQQPQE